MNGSLKDDNKDLMIQIDKYIKRVKQLENELDREKESHHKTEMIVHDMRREKESVQDRLDGEKS